MSIGQFLPRLLPAESRDYLKSPPTQFGLAALLILVRVYGTLTTVNPYPYGVAVVGLVALAGAAVFVRRPRWLVYALFLAAIVIRLYAFVHIVANGPQDVQSTRDEAVEVTAQSLLQGHNAWNANLGVGITTGPTSILLAVPFVAVFGKINWLSYGFWLALLLVLLWCDVHYQNNTWPILTMCFVLGLFDLEYTLYWSLDELYYPILYLVAAYALARSRHEWGAGALLAAAILTRPNYVFLVFGFGLWYLLSFPWDWRNLAKISLGFVVGGAVILLPFVLIGGRDLLVNNPWHYAVDFTSAGWPDNNFVFGLLNRINALIGPGAMRWVKLGLSLLLIGGVAWGLRFTGVQHPFWHITAAALVAHLVVWLPLQFPHDYTLIIVLPAMLAVAMAPRLFGAGGQRRAAFLATAGPSALPAADPSARSVVETPQRS